MTSIPTDNVCMIDRSTASYEVVRLTVEEVEGALLESRERFDSLFCDIQSIIVPFSENSNIAPIQCREAIKSLEKALQYIRDFYDLFDKLDHLPPIFTALRYRLIFQIHLIEKQAQQIISFIESYRAVCASTTSSFGSLQRHKQIYRALGILLKAISDISQQLNFIRHEACFHQKRLTDCDKLSTASSGVLEETICNEKKILCLLEQ